MIKIKFLSSYFNSASRVCDKRRPIINLQPQWSTTHIAPDKGTTYGDKCWHITDWDLFCEGNGGKDGDSQQVHQEIITYGSFLAH
jgi:hypothetical protein